MNQQRDGISRREAMRRSLGVVAGLALGGPMLNMLQAGGVSGSQVKAPARSIIQIWMWGGPSHLDTFDPKPDSGVDYTGPFDKTVATNVQGIALNAMLPNLAKQADKYAIIRSMTHGINAHETASYYMQTGRKPGRLVFPNVGAVVSRFKGYEAGYKGDVPPYVVLTDPQGRFSEAGLLGQRYKPFCTGGNPNGERFEVEGIVAEGISDQRQQSRRRLLSELDTLGRAMPNAPVLHQMSEHRSQAYDLMFGPTRKLFDLRQEPAALRDRYGRNTFGQSCLMARRLVEAGVPYVTINYKGWDTHKQHFNIMQRKLPELDAGLATLFADLSDRGLLDRTIVWWGGEFGRGPKVQTEAPWNGGRSHYGKCFSVVVGGGGFKGGQVVGASDARGMTVKERPVYPRDLIASMYLLMGIDPDGALPNPRGLDVTVLPAVDAENPGAGRLKEIMPW